MRDKDDPIRYTIDDDTRELIEAVLNNSETLADCQWDADSADDIRSLNRELGERFGIEYSTINIEESEGWGRKPYPYHKESERNG